jgi:DNA-binding MarR family transcriptional regulator
MDDLKRTTSMSSLSNQSPKPWTFVTNHTQVLLVVSHDADLRLRDIALAVGITERAAQRIVSDLIEAGYITRERVGRRNHYVVNPKTKMRHPAQREHDVGRLLQVLSQEPD